MVPSSTRATRPPFRSQRLWLGLGLLALACILFAPAYAPQTRVIHRYGGIAHRAAWVWLDAITITTESAQEGQFEGALMAPGELWVDNTLGADLTLTLGGETVYEGDDSPRVTLPDTGEDAIPFALRYTVPDSYPPDGHLAFEQANALGIRRTVPAWDYAPPGGGHSLSDTVRALFRPLSLVMGLGGVIVLVSALRISRRMWIALALILALALGARLVTLAQKFDNDPTLWTMDKIWDNYVMLGRGWIAGEVPVGGQIFQQGMFVYLGLLQMVLGPDLQLLYLFNTTVASLSAVMLALAGWALFDRPTGVIAGLLAALFPPLIHYQHTLQIVGPATWLMFALVAALAAVVRWRHPAFILLCGIAIGLGAVFRNTILVMLFLPLVVLAIQPGASWRRRALNSSLLILATALCIMPITVANLRAGVVALTADLGDYQLFRSNNLNSTGMNTYKTQSERLALARGDRWLEALARDVERDPAHPIELTLRRVALFWEPVEHSDSEMIDYRSTGLDVSPLLAALAADEQINFRLLMVLALAGFGLSVAARERRFAALLVGAALALYILSLAAFYVIGRVRMPAAPLALLLAASALTGLWSLRRSPRRLITLALPVLAAALIVTAGANALAGYLPRPNVIDSGDLPSDLVRVEATYAGEIRLLGYAYYDSNFLPGGYLTFELFWEALRQPSKDYVVSIRLVDHMSQQVQQVDNAVLGRLGTPEHPASRWQPGDVFYERYLITLPAAGDEPMSSYDILVSLYDWDAGQALPVGEATAGVLDDHVRLTAVSVITTPLDAPPDGALVAWEDAVRLTAVDCRTTPAGELRVDLAWSARRRPPQAAHLFIHVWDGDTLVDQADLPPHAIPLDAWLPGMAFHTSWRAPVGAETPTVRIGLYDVFSMRRWAITGSPDLPVADDIVELPCAQETPAPTQH